MRIHYERKTTVVENDLEQHVVYGEVLNVRGWSAHTLLQYLKLCARQGSAHTVTEWGCSIQYPPYHADGMTIIAEDRLTFLD